VCIESGHPSHPVGSPGKDADVVTAPLAPDRPDLGKLGTEAHGDGQGQTPAHHINGHGSLPHGSDGRGDDCDDGGGEVDGGCGEAQEEEKEEVLRDEERVLEELCAGVGLGDVEPGLYAVVV